MGRQGGETEGATEGRGVRVGRWVRGALVVSLVLTLALYLWGNGLTWGAIALATLPALVVLSGVSERRRLVAVGLLVLYDTGYIAYRHARSARSPARVALCQQKECSRGPIDARIISESETSLAGLALSTAIGAIRGAERDELERLLRRDYGAMDASPAWQGVPNAPLVGLRGASGRFLLALPPGKTKAPCLVFLHGFGGQLSIYVKAILDSDIGRDFVVIAPFGGPLGDFWRGQAAAELVQLISHDLPEEVDRDNVFLMGLSNGAIGATALGVQGALAGQLQGVIALSGMARAGEVGRSAPPLLVISGEDDPRFPLAYLQSQAEALTSRGAAVQVEPLAGDHFIILSRQPDVMRLVHSFMLSHLTRGALKPH